MNLAFGMFTLKKVPAKYEMFLKHGDHSKRTMKYL